MLLPGKSHALFLLVGLAAAAPSLVAQGSITSAKAQSPLGGDVDGITMGFDFNSVTLTLAGAFNPEAVSRVCWRNITTPQRDGTTHGCALEQGSYDTDFSSRQLTATATQITLNVPSFLFNGSFTGRQTIEIAEEELVNDSPVSSNVVNFFINPQPSASDVQLPDGTVGVPYSSVTDDNPTGAIVTDGTPPYTVSLGNSQPVPTCAGPFPFDSPPMDCLPSGISISPSTLLTGTPAIPARGYNFTVFITDAWGFSTGENFYSLTIYPMPSITSLAPSFAPAGSADVSIQINGSGFLKPGEETPGSAVTWTDGGIPVDLTNADVVSDTQINATIPARLLAAQVAAQIRVIQPNGAQASAPFLVIGAPSLSALSPTVAPAGSGAFTLTVQGSNFVSISGASSQIVFGSTTLTTTFVSGTTLTASVPANLVVTPGIVAVRVMNPGGLISNAVNFSVGAPVISALSPASTAAGGAALPLMVQGSNFVSASQIVFGATALTTTFVNATTLTATIPANLIAAPGIQAVHVVNPGNIASNSLNFTIAAVPVITPPLAPSSVGAGSSTLTVTINGTGFTVPVSEQTAGSTVTWTAGGNTVTLPATVASATQIQATVAANLLAAPVTAQIRVVAPNGVQSNAANFTVGAPVVTSLTPNSAAAGLSSLTLTVHGAFFVNIADTNNRARRNVIVPGASRAGASSQVFFGSTALATMFVNDTTLTAVVPANLLASTGVVPIHVVNPGGVSSGTFNFTIVTPVSPLEISGTPLQGTVGVPYSTSFAASGGTQPYQFSLAGGSLPPGLKLSADGFLTGTPTQAGQFPITIQLSDSTGANTSAGFTISILPAPLTLTGTVGDLALGAAVNVTFGATGGAPPYTFTAAGALPSGLQFSNGVLSGTPSAAGTFAFTISVQDKAGTVASRTFTIKVAIGALTISGALGDGQAGVPYTAQLSATGGKPPYSFAAAGLPPGVSLSSSGAASGTPTTAGPYTVAVTVTDSAGGSASQTFAVTIAPAGLSITTTSLPDGAVAVPYSASLTATGGTPPYTWNFSGLPAGISGSAGGSLSGTPTTVGTSQVTVSVSDSKGAKASASFTLAIALTPLSITSDSLPAATVGVALSGSLSATGGTPPYQWSASGLPAGVSLSSGGALSGKPASPGTAFVSVTVTDSKGTSATKTLPMTVTLPSSPGMSFTGLPGSTNPASQPTVTIGLGTTFPVDVVADLTMTFAPDSGPDDPAVQFSSGGRIAHITIPAGTTVSPSGLGVQTGTVAGLITITAHLTAAGQDITGTPIPTITIRVNATAPVISSVTATRNSSGFTVTVTGFASSRDLTQAIFQFTAATGTTLTSNSVTVPVDAIFAQWFQSSDSAQFGSQFTYTQPFTVPGGASSIVSVNVTLVSKAGSSTPVSANLQ